MKRPRSIDITFLVIAVIFCIYAGLFIYRTSFLIEGERYFSLFDDAMISMRYAKNFASSNGLVWNPGGDRVEGYTNPLWTLHMSAMHLIPVGESKTSLLVQVSSLIFLLLNLAVVRKLALAASGGSGFVKLGALLTTAFYLPLNGWSLQGMEVGVLALLVTFAAWKGVESLRSGTFSVWPYLSLMVGSLVRADGAVPFVAFLIFMAAKDSDHRRKHLLFGGALLVGAVLTQTVFRVAYYGEILPNSYYLKLAGYPFLLRLTRGIYVNLVFIWRMNWILFLVPFLLLMNPRRREHLLLIFIFLVQLAYSVYVGGDAWESWGGANRYVCIAMPCFFVAYFAGLERMGSWIKEHILLSRPGLGGGRLERLGRITRVGILVLSFVSFNAIYGLAALTEVMLLKPTLHIEKNQKMVERALALKQVTREEATIATVWDGAIPYFADRTTVSILGKNDKRVARQKMRRASGPGQLVAFYPGHLKWDYAYSIGRLKPDVVVQLWEAQEEAGPFLAVAYIPGEVGDFTFHFLRGSSHILWDKITSPTSVPDR